MGALTRTDGRRRLRAPQRRARILQAATEVFAERGYAAASMAEIAARAEVVASVIYDHFRSKRELHVELLELHGEALMERSIRYLDGASPEEQLRANIEAYYEFVEQHPFVWRFLFRDAPSDPQIADVHRRIHDRATAGIAALIRASAPGAGDVAAIPAERAAWMLAKASQSATNGLAQWWWENRDVARQDVVTIAARLLWTGTRGFLAADRDAAAR